MTRNIATDLVIFEQSLHIVANIWDYQAPDVRVLEIYSVIEVWVQYLISLPQLT